MKALNVGTLNIRICNGTLCEKSIHSNNSSYQLQILAITETHVKREEAVYDAKIDGKAYKSFERGVTGNNSFTGVGSSIDAYLYSQLKRVNDRICVVKAYTNQTRKCKLIAIVSYVLKVQVSVKPFYVREDFYQETTCKRKTNRSVLLFYWETLRKDWVLPTKKIWRDTGKDT